MAGEKTPPKCSRCGREIKGVENMVAVYVSYEGRSLIVGFRHIKCPVQGEEVKSNE